MGWTYSSIYGFGSMKQFVQQYTYETDNVKSTALDYSVINRNILYVAVEQIIKQTGERKVTAAIVEFKFNKKEYGYKDMDETMGPYHYSCPERILNLLTPTTNEFALKWRSTCRERQKRTKAFVMKEGQRFIRKTSWSDTVNVVTLLRPINKSSWVGIDELGRQYRYSKQWLLIHNYDTEENYFENNL